ncbi:carbohydrate-binding family 9-like protein [Parabacteroides sp. OttesenSCG-928-G07]|nr:carbohydrate-binding family 9-like protein [Parabacteroides sp. OttesenSCG-928-G07]
MTKNTLLLTGLFALICINMAVAQNGHITYAEQPPFNPPNYICYKITNPITIDGIISASEWDAIPWIEGFKDIMGDKGKAPHLETKVKMAHDDTGIYFAAWMEEPHIWATYTEHDSPLYQDKAFEIVFDLNNNTHDYLEYEVNALGTVWDLYLSKPYRDNPVTFNDWEFMGMKSAVHLDGTLNNPNDTDKSWSVEVFIPWKSLYQVVPRKRKPADGDQIRMNFQRVHWPLLIKDGKYEKAPKPEGERFAESYWLWAPIGTPSTHLPEFWGYVQFSDKMAGTEEVAFLKNPEEDIRWMLRNLYYRQNEYKRATGAYASVLSVLKPEDVCPSGWINKLTLDTTPTMYEITLSTDNAIWHIRQDGLVWKSNN